MTKMPEVFFFTKKNKKKRKKRNARGIKSLTKLRDGYQDDVELIHWSLWR
jgi:hypothetical protein